MGNNPNLCSIASRYLYAFITGQTVYIMLHFLGKNHEISMTYNYLEKNRKKWDGNYDIFLG